jgi:hypothetical protein
VTDLPDPGRFGAAFEEFIRAMSEVATRGESELSTRIAEHLGADPKTLPTTTVELPTTEQANLQLGLDAALGGRGEVEVIGFSARGMGYMPLGLAELVSGQAMTGPISMGPPRYASVEIGDGRIVRCITNGIFLTRAEGEPIVIVVSPTGERGMGPGKLRLEGVGASEESVAAAIAAIRGAMREHNVFRGRVISLHGDDHSGGVSVQFHTLPDVARDAVILPDGTLARLERHAIGIAAQGERLRAAGRHLKRGVLLHGPPGTGKTLSVTYLLGAMPGRTVVLLTGRSLGLIEHATSIARELAPATVVFEDIDLVAAERTMPWSQGVLFDLLNQMEGVGEDADLLFLLTTNRPDVIEPALAARPGRVDLALEIPLPDAAARARLIALYAGDVSLEPGELATVVERTHGVSGAFVKELMRQATLRAATDGRAATGADALSALDELLEERSALTRRLLGQPAHGAPTEGPTATPMPQMLQAFQAAGLPIPDEITVIE